MLRKKGQGQKNLARSGNPKHTFFFNLGLTTVAAICIPEVLSTALAKHHANGDTSMVTEIVNLCPIM